MKRALITYLVISIISLVMLIHSLGFLAKDPHPFMIQVKAECRTQVIVSNTIRIDFPFPGDVTFDLRFDKPRPMSHYCNSMSFIFGDIEIDDVVEHRSHKSLKPYLEKAGLNKVNMTLNKEALEDVDLHYIRIVSNESVLFRNGSTQFGIKGTYGAMNEFQPVIYDVSLVLEGDVELLERAPIKEKQSEGDEVLYVLKHGTSYGPDVSFAAYWKKNFQDSINTFLLTVYGIFLGIGFGGVILYIVAR